MTRPAFTALCVIAIVCPLVGPAAADGQKEADKFFKSGVALFKEGKYAEALAEFERAYEIAPHPLVLYNIAGCHRELSHYALAVKNYEKFLAEGKGKVPASRLTAARNELDGILARIARVSVTIAGVDGATLILDGEQLGTLLEMPLILAPGEHKFVARAPGHKDAERTLRLASGDEMEIELTLPELPPAPPMVMHRDERDPTRRVMRQRRLGVGAGFGTNLGLLSATGAPSLDVSVAVTPRLQLGVDAVLVAFAVMPAVRLRVAGDRLAMHLIAGMPIAFTDGDMKETFVAGAVGLGVRYHLSTAVSFRLESFVSYAGKQHGTTVPTFLGGELWF